MKLRTDLLASFFTDDVMLKSELSDTNSTVSMDSCHSCGFEQTLEIRTWILSNIYDSSFLKLFGPFYLYKSFHDKCLIGFQIGQSIQEWTKWKLCLSRPYSFKFFKSLSSTNFNRSILKHFVSNVPLLCSNTSEWILCSTKIGYVVYIWLLYFWRKHRKWSINCPGNLFQTKSFRGDASSDWALNWTWAHIIKNKKKSKNDKKC